MTWRYAWIEIGPPACSGMTDFLLESLGSHWEGTEEEMNAWFRSWLVLVPMYSLAMKDPHITEK